MDEKEEVTSTQKSLSSSHDPGWNDPPKWAFSPVNNTGTTPTKRLLNKRVAFPLSSAQPVSNPGADQLPPCLPDNCPPPVHSTDLTSAPHAPLVAPTGCKSSGPSKILIDKDTALKETLENFESVIGSGLESNPKTEEVKRRLDAMKIMWQEDKLKDQIYERMLELSRALKKNDIEAADKIHVSLMMDHAAICNTWISGVRHIILELRSKLSEPNSVSSASNSHQYFLPQSVQSDNNA